MRKYIFLVLYSFLIISYFLIGRIPVVGSIGFLQFSEIIMLIVCVVEDRKLVFDKYLFLYLFFWMFRLLSALFYNFVDETIDTIIRYAPSAFVLCWSSAILTKKYSSYLPLFLIVPLVFIGILNSFVTYCQSNGIFVFDLILERLNAVNEEEMSYIARHGDRFGLSVSGIFGTPVRNGHNSLFILLGVLLLKRRSPFIIYGSVFLIMLVGLFFCQQRSTFFLGIIFSLLLFTIILYKNGHKKLLMFIILLFLLIIPPILLYLKSLDTRVTDVNLDNRSGVWIHAVDFILSHPLFGSYEMFFKQEGLPPHNLILSAFISGGLFGGMILLFLVVLQLSLIFKLLKKYKSDEVLIISCIYMALTADSFFHNSGLVEINGASLLSWGLVLGLSKRKRNEIGVYSK